MLDEVMGKSNAREKELLNYYGSMDFTTNNICEKCREHTPSLKEPVGAWLIGDRFYDHEKKVMFIGKNARGTPGEDCGDFHCPYFDSRKRLWQMAWPYWRYTREIVCAVYGDDSIENISFTNMVKCNDSDDIDTTSDFTKNCCIVENRVIRSEIALIQPTHVIFYSSWYYDYYIPKIFDEFTVQKDTKIYIGKKTVLWLEADCKLQGESIKVLRTGHPERLKKIDFVNAVSGWIQKA